MLESAHFFGDPVAYSFQILKLRLRRTLLATLLLSSLSTTGAVLSYYQDWFGSGSQELSAYDTGLNFWTKDPHQPWAFWAKLPQVSSQVVLVAIDDKTLQAMNANEEYHRKFDSWPYVRTVWANVIHYFDKSTTAKALVFDLLLPESKSSDIDMKETLEQSTIPVYLGFDFTPSGRQLPKVEAQNHFPSSIQEKLISSPELFSPKSPQENLLAAKTLAFPVQTKSFTLSQLPAKEVFDKDGNSLGMQKLWPNPPTNSFWNLMTGFGLVNTESDEGVDAKMRSTHFAYTDGTNSYVTLSMAVAADLLHAPTIQIEPRKLKVGDRVFAINPDGSAFIDYGGNFAQRFVSVSLFDVLSEALALKEAQEQGKPFSSKLAPLFANKVIVIGASGTGTSDLRSTPFENFAPGMVKHASEIDSFLGGRFIVDAPLWVSVLLSFIIAFFSALVILVLQSPRLEVLWPIVQFLVAYFGPGFFLVYFHYHLLSVMPSVAATLASIFATVYDLFWFSKKRDAFKEQFLPFMEESFVHLLSELKVLPSLSAGYQEVTLLSFSPKNTEMDLVTFTKSVNQYLTTLTPVLYYSQAYLLPEEASSFTALWGSPFLHYSFHDQKDTKENPALIACKTAIKLLQHLPEIEKNLTEQGLPFLKINMGIWTGSAFLGNLEITPKPRFTLLGTAGEPVKQIEALNSFYGTKILLDDTTYAAVKDHVIAREIDWIRIKGSSSFVTIYELLDVKEENPEKTSPVSLFEQALSFYRQARFTEALWLLEASKPQSSEEFIDKATQLLVAQCKTYQKHPPLLPFVGSLFLGNGEL